MGIRSVLIANRGEIAIRIARAAADLGLRSVMIYPADDERSLHVRRGDEARALPGQGAAAYLDVEAVVAAATKAGCDALHPGYGFLSESPALARACAAAGIVFVGPSPDTLETFGDKLSARSLAERCGVPVLAGSGEAVDTERAHAFFEALPSGTAMLIKAVSGGGGRGMRIVRAAGEIEAALERCRSEAEKAFGCADVYAEAYLENARHIEVQVVGDGRGGVTHLFERECSLQRQHQKLVEVAPAPDLDPAVRDQLFDAAIGLAREVGYAGVGTFEFLVDAETGRFAFIEANPRLQVEHTVTEAVTGIDIVQTQLRLADGASLAELAFGDVRPAGFAIQARVNMERMGKKGMPLPSGGTIGRLEIPSGPGVRVDHFASTGYTTSPLYDSLLAKVITHVPTADWRMACTRSARALAELRVDGVATNATWLRALLQHPDVLANRVHTRFVEEHAAEISDAAEALERAAAEAGRDRAAPSLAGASIDPRDPLAVLEHGKRAPGAATTAGAAAVPQGPAGSEATTAPLQGTIVSVEVAEGDSVRTGQTLVVMEAMKMEHVIAAPRGGIVRRVSVASGDTVFQDHPLVYIEASDALAAPIDDATTVDLDHIRPDLAEVLERHGMGQDENRPAAVARRRKTGQRTARENVADLCDEGSYIEYGALTIAAQRRRRSLEDLTANTPADGMLAGIGHVNGALFEDADSRCVVMSYDYTVLAGTQGLQNHRKKDRLFELAERMRLPLVFFTEGGGGRPGDTDGFGGAGLECWAFQYFAKLSGLVPLVGINSGRCFAGNAVLLGCCDVIIATANSNIGVGGPAMIEGGGLGVFRPEEVGPMSVQVPNGVVDIAVEDEAEAVEVAKKYLAYFQGPLPEWTCEDQRLLRSAIPENRLRIYEVRSVIETLVDSGSVLELRREFGHGMVTALARIEGRPIGIVANDPKHLAGAIDRDGADKGARFMQLCDAFDIPILFLCDTPGIMVGPEIEKEALVRHAARMFVVGADLDVPIFTVVLRKAYGLGAQAMAGGSFKAPVFTLSWPTGEFGGMGLEGAVKLGYRKEIAAIEDPEERQAFYQKMVDMMYRNGRAVAEANVFEIDDVIDPADTRRWIVNGLRAAPSRSPREGKKRPCIDTW